LNDKVFYLDPGKVNCFTAMEGISTPNIPAPIIKLSSGEYGAMMVQCQEVESMQDGGTA